MNEEYLWDRSGEPDPEIEALERTLAPLRYRHREITLPRTARVAHPTRWAMAAAAALVLAAIGLSRLRRRRHRPPRGRWRE